MKVLILVLLVTGFFLLFREMKVLKHVADALKKTRSEMNAAARQRSLADRQRLLSMQEKHSRWYSLEQQLQYCGIKSRFPGMTAEWWLLGHLTGAALLFTTVSAVGGPGKAALLVLGCAGAEGLFLRRLRRKNFRRTEENLTKLLDFLGNYSITSGEITGIFGQISRYMEEPVKSALDACCYEAATTGDVGMALSAMAERIEHPKFRELARNMEVSVRYCADFSVLVNSSRRSLREYLRVARERRGMLREGAVNLALLAGMSVVVLLIVGSFTGSGRGF
ncbi:MAG: hypothetical protein NC123_09300 [Butyrivibrio sp.]|nr:hypothetical protein [Acetatifactor muris]MCM1559730.1 hypothetical protein [Butyrivibrio sp.]